MIIAIVILTTEAGMMWILAALGVILLTAQPSGADDSCRSCHENRKTMDSLGYGHFTVTQKEVETQSRMPATCSGCHLGDPTAAGKQEAHKGLARLLVTRKNGLVTDTAPRPMPLELGNGPMNTISVSASKDGKKVKDQTVVAISWHDKRPDTLTQDFEVMRKTCGSCHEKEFAEFSRSTMGTNGKQSQYKGWLDKRGPHNCGPWFEGNFDRIQAATAVPTT